jgi:hypothetical protein
MKQKAVGALAVIAVMLTFTPALPARGVHPEIQAALEAMRTARTHLQEAKHEFHGHRAAAIKHLDGAIHEAEVCLEE